jgi:hypothetical protein
MCSKENETDVSEPLSIVPIDSSTIIQIAKWHGGKDFAMQ